MFLIINKVPNSLLVKNKSNIKKVYKDLQECLSNNKLNNDTVIVTANKDDALYCEKNKIPCIYYAGNSFIESKLVHQIKSQYKGITCTANCNREYCTEKLLLNVDYQPCQIIDSISNEDIEFAIHKVKYPFKQDKCKYCNRVTHMYLSNQKNVYICEKCNGLNILDIDSYYEKVDYNLGRFGTEIGTSLFTEPSLIYLIDKRLEYLTLEKLMHKKILVIADDYGTITYWLQSNNLHADYYEHNPYYKEIAFTLFGIESIANIDYTNYDIVIIGDYNRALVDLKLLKDYIIFIKDENTITAANKLNAKYLYEINVNINPIDKFGAIFNNALPINQNLILHLSELVKNITERKYFVASSINLTNNKIELNEQAKNALDKYFKYHNIFVDQQLEILNKGNDKKVLLTDHFELTRNYIEYFKEFGYTVGVIHKDKRLNLTQLTKEIQDFNPNFFFSGFYPDAFLSKDVNGNWNFSVATDYFFRTFNFPIIMRKVDHPFVVYDFLPEMLKIIHRYNNKFALITHDNYLASLYRQLGVKNVTSLPAFNLIAKSFDYTCKCNKPLTNKKKYDILFPGSISNIEHNKAKDYIHDVTDIRKFTNKQPIKNNFFNKEYFIELDTIAKAARNLIVNDLKKNYNVKTAEDIFIP